MDVAEWLRGLGLEQYAPAFRENDVDAEVLPELTADDLIGIGVTSIGHHRKLLSAIVALNAARATAPAPADAERRQLTVMFCDLVGSTALSTRFDPEDLREVIGAYHRTVAEIVAGLGGFVSRFMGDGVLIYFGYPQAHEDDAERAVRAGRHRRCPSPRRQMRQTPSSRRDHNRVGGRRRSDRHRRGAGAIRRR
jgi:class 3 adenylate cyclase